VLGHENVLVSYLKEGFVIAQGEVARARKHAHHIDKVLLLLFLLFLNQARASELHVITMPGRCHVRQDSTCPFSLGTAK